MAESDNAASLAEFLSGILDGEAPDEKYYAYIKRNGRDPLSWHLFIACDDVHGKRRFASNYPLKGFEMKEMVNYLRMKAE